MNTKKIIAQILQIADTLDNNGYDTSSLEMTNIAEKLVKQENEKTASSQGRVKKIIPYQNRFSQLEDGYNADFSQPSMEENPIEEDPMEDPAYNRIPLEDVHGSHEFVDKLPYYDNIYDPDGHKSFKYEAPEIIPNAFGEFKEPWEQRDPDHFKQALDKLISNHPKHKRNE